MLRRRGEAIALRSDRIRDLFGGSRLPFQLAGGADREFVDVSGLLLGIFRGEHVAPRQLAADFTTGFRASVLVLVSRQDYLHGVIPETAAGLGVAYRGWSVAGVRTAVVFLGA